MWICIFISITIIIIISIFKFWNWRLMRIAILKIFGLVFRKIYIFLQRKFKGISIFCFTRLASSYEFSEHLPRVTFLILVRINNFFNFIYYLYFQFLFFCLLVTSCVQIFWLFLFFAYLFAKDLKWEINYFLIFELITKIHFFLL